MKKSVLLFISSFLLIMLLTAESLWDDRAKDIYSRKINYTAGDSVSVIVTEASSIDYRSNSKTLKTYNFDMTGKELTGLFTFMPKGSADETGNSQSTDNLRINTVIQGRVLRVYNNYVTIQATRQVTIDNKVSTINITGDANMKDISGNSIYSNKLMNPVMAITTLLDNSKTIITPNDLQTTVINPESTTDKKTETTLSDAKKRQLMLYYFNKILNVIF